MSNQDKYGSEESYLSAITQRLEAEGFTIEKDITFKGQTFDYVAKRTRFEIDKFGFMTTSFFFARFSAPDIDINELKHFSKIAFKFASRAGGILPIGGGIRVPRMPYFSISCYPVAVVNEIDESVARAFRSQAPPKHFMAFEMPVVYSLKSQELYYCEVTPIHGGLYYDQMRMTINAMLAP
jgi:hypothetical protein